MHWTLADVETLPADVYAILIDELTKSQDSDK
jgi:hypothetical protein